MLLVLSASVVGSAAVSQAVPYEGLLNPERILNVLQVASVENCFTSRLNAERAVPLTTRADLVALARKHSGRMASSSSIYHNSRLADEAPPDWQSLGENVGVGPECSEIHQAFMNSPTHRKNILDTDFNLIGVGVVITQDGSIYVTEVFMQSGFDQGAAAPSGTGRPGETPAGPAEPIPGEAPAPAVPGSKINGQISAYLDQLESDHVPSEEESKAYRDDARISAEGNEKDKSFFSRIKGFFSSMFSSDK